MRSQWCLHESHGIGVHEGDMRNERGSYKKHLLVPGLSLESILSESELSLYSHVSCSECNSIHDLKYPEINSLRYVRVLTYTDCGICLI